MLKLARKVLLAAVATSMVVPGAAFATHMNYYNYNAVEHDDQGRSDEPDFAKSGVLGVLAVNCVVDFTILDPGCSPDTALPPPVAGHSPVLAPGCSDDSGRRPSGLCGLWTIGVRHQEVAGDVDPIVPGGIIGVQGMTGNNAPGRHSATKSTAIRFLDIHTNAHYILPALSGSHYINYNRKLTDTGISATLRALDPNFGGDAIVGDTAIWAWYGNWADKNGNGVVDHLGDGNGNVPQDNEFVWVGKCIQFDGTPAPPGQQYCKEEIGVVMPLWVYPGNHHAFCGGVLPAPVPAETRCWAISADIPGHQLICFVDVVSGGLTPVFCPGSVEDIDLFDEALFGDPILSSQDALWPDQNIADRTGDVNIGTRQWVFGNGWETRFYDQSLLVSTVLIGGPTTQPFDPTSRQKLPYDLGLFHSLDVDHYRTVSPAIEQFLQGTLKPAARSNWVSVRDNFVPILATMDQYRNNKALDTSEQTMPVDDRLVNPGWSREPNTALDSFPAARFNAFPPSGELPASEQLHRGWLNDYSGHAGAWHAFADINGFRMWHTNVAWRRPGGSCLPSLCTTGGGTFSTNQYLSPNDAGQHKRTMEPGFWVFSGAVLGWQDMSHAVTDEVVDLEATLAQGRLVVARTDYTTPRDGWLGNIVNTTGTWKYRGYPGPGDSGAPECTIAGVKATRYFAECNPYWSGTTADASPYTGPFQDPGVDIENPTFGPGEGETAGIFPLRSVFDQNTVKVYPAGAGGSCNINSPGTWSVPVIRWNSFDTWTIGDTSALVDFTGKSGAAAVIRLPAGIGSGLFTRDVLLLPEGNLGLTVCTEVSEPVLINDTARGIFVNEFVRDIDVYAPYA